MLIEQQFLSELMRHGSGHKKPPLLLLPVALTLGRIVLYFRNAFSERNCAIVEQSMRGQKSVGQNEMKFETRGIKMNGI